MWNTNIIKFTLAFSLCYSNTQIPKSYVSELRKRMSNSSQAFRDNQSSQKFDCNLMSILSQNQSVKPLLGSILQKLWSNKKLLF
jgi:hypothetical protein